MKNREIFDRYQALQHKSEWSMDANASDHLIYGVVLNGFITSPAMHELEEEFEHVYLTEEGLVIRD